MFASDPSSFIFICPCSSTRSAVLSSLRFPITHSLFLLTLPSGAGLPIPAGYGRQCAGEGCADARRGQEPCSLLADRQVISIPLRVT